MSDFQTELMQHFAQVTGVPVMQHRPRASEDVPPAWVQVERAGGRAGLATDRPLYTVIFWAESQPRVDKLAAALRLHFIHKLPPRIGGFLITAHSEAAAPVDNSLPGATQESLRWLIEVQHSHGRKEQT